MAGGSLCEFAGGVGSWCNAPAYIEPISKLEKSCKNLKFTSIPLFLRAAFVAG